MGFQPYAVSWNLTSRCNLACQHCYIDADCREKGDGNELSTEKVFDILAQIAQVNSGVVMILTGGEPLMRKDILEIAAEAKRLGMMVVVGTNGTMLTPKVVADLKNSGVSGIGVSIDSLKDETHDSFRGAPGSLKKSIEGLKYALEGGLEVQVQTTASEANIGEIPEIAKWAYELGAKVFNLFFLVCTGRGESVSDISPDSYEKVLEWAASAQSEFPGMMVRPKCAPHFKRLLYQKDKNHPLLNTYIAACRAGTHYCRITPEGEVSPCPYMPEIAGDLKTTDFKTIWDESEALNRFRTPEYGGKCGMCQYRLICGGCRARAYATLGDDMGEDQWCVYEPMTQEEAITNADAEAKFDSSDLDEAMSDKWTEESKAKMGRMPVFARSIVQKTVERYCEENNIDVITPEVMRTAAPPPGEFSGRGGPSFAMPKTDAKEEADLPTDTGEDIPWDEDARSRLKDAPDFVRPGIVKLMQKRARERKQKRITTEFLTEIRNESMMLVTRRMKKFGFEELDMSAWDTAKEKFKKNAHKQEVIDEIAGFLGDREKPNEFILKKFESYFEDDSKEIGWTKEAREILKKTPFFVRGKAKAFIEKHAKESGYKYVTDTAIKEAMEKLPFASMMKR